MNDARDLDAAAEETRDELLGWHIVPSEGRRRGLGYSSTPISRLPSLPELKGSFCGQVQG
jgi:hypothetical protein